MMKHSSKAHWDNFGTNQKCELYALWPNGTNLARTGKIIFYEN